MGILCVDNVSRSFGGINALDVVSFDVEDGSITALIGPNGAGKTTLINIISGLDKPDSGNINFAGEQIQELPGHVVAARGVTRTFQILKGFQSLTLLENVMIGGHLWHKTGFWKSLLPFAHTATEERNLKNRAMSLLQLVKLDAQANRPLCELPHGQQRMVDLARALCVNPRIMLLDEPGAGLNPREIDQLEETIRTARDRGTTILLVEHNMRMVMKVSEKIVVLNFGRKIAEGTPETVCNDPVVTEAYLGKEQNV